MEEKNEVIKEKKKIQISLGLTICLIVLFLFLMMIGVIVGMILINKKQDEELVEKAKEAQKQLEQAIENEEKLEASTNEILQQYLQQEAKDKNINETNSNEFLEGSYVFCNDNKYSLSSAKVEFGEGGFVISVGELFIVNGDYTVSNGEIKCDIGSHSFEENNSISLSDKNWRIIFRIINDKEIEVKSNNCDEETEISITLSNLFYEGASFELYDLNDYIGTWNSTDIYIDGESVSLTSYFGTGYLSYGSKLILKEDGTFEDWIQPIQSNEFSNTGKWEYCADHKYSDKSGEGILLDYDDEREGFLKLWESEEGATILNYYNYGEDTTITLTK